jgi:hypothetical protein
MNKFLQGQNNKVELKDEGDIGLKDIILKIQEWWGVFWLHKTRVIAISIFIGFGSASYTKFLTKPSYIASYQLFFQEESVGLSSAMRLASSFGLGGGGGSASSSSTVHEFLTSRKNIAHAMTLELENGRLLDRYYKKAFIENKKFAQEFELKFDFNQRYKDSIISVLFEELNFKVLTASFNDETGILQLNVVHNDEIFAYDLAKNIVENTEKQFKDWKRDKSQVAVDAFQKKVDSLETSIDEALYALGLYEDQNNSLVSSVDMMKRMRLSINFESLKVAYGEYIKGLEMSKSELINLEGPFKYFDTPTYPLKKEKKSVAKSGILGSLISGFLIVIFYICREEVKTILSDPRL